MNPFKMGPGPGPRGPAVSRGPGPSAGPRPGPGLILKRFIAYIAFRWLLIRGRSFNTF